MQGQVGWWVSGVFWGMEGQAQSVGRWGCGSNPWVVGGAGVTFGWGGVGRQV